MRAVSTEAALLLPILMLAFPNAKINIGLDILRKRNDGYHDIESCLYPVPWYDVLEVIPHDHFVFEQTGRVIPGDHTDNLCVKAFEILQKLHGISPVAIYLHKVIPMGAGLGGGSSDGAFTLKLINAVLNLGLKAQELKMLAAELGSDCPFFIDNIPAIATGRGTEISPLALDLSEYYIGIKKPPVHIGTAEAYSGVIPSEKTTNLKERLTYPLQSWKDHLQNDFESSLFSSHALLSELKDSIYHEGAIYASMSGSGSSLYGIFTQKPSSLDEYDLFESLASRI